MQLRLAIFLIIITLIMFVTGCWNRRELNELAVAILVGIDKEDSEYLLTVQIVNPGEVAQKSGGGLPRTAVTTYHATGNTIFEALRRLTPKVPRKIYFSHLRMLVIGEELAKEEGISKVLEFLSRDHEVRTDFYIAIAKGTKGHNILHILTPMDEIPGQKLYSSLEMSEHSFAATSHITLDQLIGDIISEGNNPVLTGVEIEGDMEIGKTEENIQTVEAEAILKYSGLAAFKKDKLVGWLNEDESKGYNYIVGNVKNTVEAITCPKKEEQGITIEVVRSKPQIKGKVEKGKPEITIKIDVEGKIGEIMCDIELNTKTIYELEQITEKRIEGYINEVVNKSQKEYKSDIFGFGDVIHRADPKEWKKMKDTWNDEWFPDLSVNVSVDVKIRQTGTTGKSYLEEIKE